MADQRLEKESRKESMSSAPAVQEANASDSKEVKSNRESTANANAPTSDAPSGDAPPAPVDDAQAKPNGA